MASFTKTTRWKRKRRRKNMGKDRKAQHRIHGTTPTFAIHTPEVDAAAPAAQVSPTKTAS